MRSSSTPPASTPRARLARRSPAAAAAVAVLLVSGCTTPATTPGASGSAGASATGGTSASVSQSPTAPATPVATPAAGASNKPSTGGVTYAPTASGPLDGKTVVLDPGHNKVWDTKINWAKESVWGSTWPSRCQAQGATGIDGTTLEPDVTWAVAQKTLPLLTAQGATVVLTRPDNAGTGPCNVERANISNQHKADLLLSIHINSAKVTRPLGYHIIWSDKMKGGAALSTASQNAAKLMSDQMQKNSTLQPSTYLSAKGWPIDMDDKYLSVLNNNEHAAAILVEFGSMSSPEEFKLMTTDAGQEGFAKALAGTAHDQLTGVAPSKDGPQASATPSAKPAASGSASAAPSASASPTKK